MSAKYVDFEANLDIIFLNLMQLLWFDGSVDLVGIRD